MTVELATHPKVKLRVADFDLLAENGGLAGLERTELLDGDMYLMSPQYSAHSNAKSHFYEALYEWKQIHRRGLAVRTETSVAMPPNDEPMPDVILCDQPMGNKAILVETVYLLIEIADDSRERDLGYKKQLYGRQGAPEYWVIDLDKRLVWQFSAPSEQGYASERKAKFGETVVAETLAGLAVETVGLG